MEFVPQTIISYTSQQLTQEYADWNNATTYIVGDKVIYGNYIWICSFDGSLNFEPKEDSPHWTKWGSSNYWSLIDPRSQTLTVVNSDFIVEFDKSGIETLVIGYFRGVSILVEVLDASNNVIGTPEIFRNPRREGIPSYLAWIHAKFIDYSSRSKVFYLPLFGSKIRVTFSKGSYSNVQVGFMVGGRSTQMGKTKEGVKLGRTSYTIKNTDEFGITTITSRAKRKYHDFETSVNSDIAMSTLRIIENYEDVVMAFIIDNNVNSKYENIVTLGVYESVEPLATNNDKTILSWTVIETI